MIWVSWRQHRSQAVAGLCLLAALAVYAVVLGSSMRTAFGQDGLVTCLARSQGTGCPAGIQAFTNRFGSAVNVAFWSVLLILPGLIGVLVGGPLFGFAVLAGLLLRRSIPAMVAAFVSWLAIRLVVEFVFRPHFQAPLTFRQICPHTGGCFGGYGLGFLPPVTGHIGDWVLGRGPRLPANLTGNTYLYQPASRFEAGIFVALTAAALGATIWLLHRRAS